MADLEEHNDNSDQMVTLTESETKEILMTMVKDLKNKGRNYASALKAKKNRDLARGYGAGRDGILKPGAYSTKCQFLSSKREPSVTPAVLLDIRLVNARPSPARALIRMARTNTSRPKPRR